MHLESIFTVVINRQGLGLHAVWLFNGHTSELKSI